MVKKSTKVFSVDKVGVWWVKVFHLYKGSSRKVSTQGNKVKVSIKTTRPNNWITKGTKLKMLLVRVKKQKEKQDGTFIKFFNNCGVFFKKKKGIKRREIIGPVIKNIKKKKLFKYVGGLI